MKRIPVLVAVAAGGVLGALSRYALSLAWPHARGDFPWSTFVINVSGCFLLGVLMALIARHWPTQRLIRPFLGVGVLGGYTTFSTAMVETLQSRPVVAILYLFGTAAAGVTAVFLGHEMARAR